MKSHYMHVLITHYRWPLVLGLILCAASPSFHSFGVFSAWMAMGLGATGGTFREWRSEPGLWMLSVFFLSIFAPLWAILISGIVLDVMRQGFAPPPLLHLLDFSIGA